ncbi:MAG: GNAT family N-acetyltransferase [Proteobacteria bacterium]|nr:GNAT family N-acetyltransferase [Pseudomonadota bacterium]
MKVDLKEFDFEGFFSAPFNVYGAMSLYVSPMKSDLKRFLDPQQNPLFQSNDDLKYFTAYQNYTAVGRILVHIHRSSNLQFKQNRAYFGYFDCINDDAVARKLLNAAEEWARAKNMSELIGNFNMTAMQQIGVVTSGFQNQPYSDQVYNPSHIVDLLVKNSYQQEFPMKTFEIDVDKAKDLLKHSPPPETMDGLRFESVKKSNLSQKLEHARLLLNDGFSENPMFVPITKEEFDFQAKDLMWVLDPKISFIAYHLDKPVGVIVCIPDINPSLQTIKSQLTFWSIWKFLFERFKKPTRAVIIYYSVAKAFHGKSIMKHLLKNTINGLAERGYKSVGVTWIADINQASLKQMDRLGARVLHTTHLYKKTL